MLCNKKKILTWTWSPFRMSKPQAHFSNKSKKRLFLTSAGLDGQKAAGTFTRSPKNGLSQTLQLFAPTPGDVSLDFRCFPFSSSITPELSAERASTKPHWDFSRSTRRRIPTYGQQGGVAGSSALRQLKTQRWSRGGATTCATRANYGALNVAGGATSVEQRFLQRRSRMAFWTLLSI